MPYTRAQLSRMFATLPDDVKDAMTSVDTVEVLKEIKDRYKLHIDQAGDLSAEIAMLMVGASQPQKFISNIEKATGLPKETAKTIATEINDKIFKKVRNSLKEIHKMDSEKKYRDTKKEETIQSASPSSEEPQKVINDPYKEPI